MRSSSSVRGGILRVCSWFGFGRMSRELVFGFFALGLRFGCEYGYERRVGGILSRTCRLKVSGIFYTYS